LIGIGNDDGVATAEPDAGPAVPGEFHVPRFLHTAMHRRVLGPWPVDRSRKRSPGIERPEAPAQSAPPVGGREDGT
jgi:hypothetical protein